MTIRDFQNGGNLPSVPSFRHDAHFASKECFDSRTGQSSVDAIGLVVS